MKKYLTAAALLTILLTGCSGKGEIEVHGAPDATFRPSAAASPAPAREAAPLRKAIDDARAEHTGADEAVQAMDALGMLAQEELKPVAMSADLLDLREMEVEIMRGYNGTDSGRETILAVQEYAVAVEKTAVEYDVLP